MGVITLKIDDDLEIRLRQKAGKTRGAGRGSLSASVEEALKLWLKTGTERSTLRQEERVFTAIKNRKRIAKASSLDDLSKQLAKLGIDSRDVVIESNPPLPPKRERLGARMTSRI